MSQNDQKKIRFNHLNESLQKTLKIALINLMPQKEVTEEQFFRLLSKSQQPLEIQLIKMESYQSTTTDKEHLETYYQTLAEVREQFFDGLIITGAPIETIPFEEVSYWQELVEILRWSQQHCRSTIHICWGAQAGLYQAFGVEKVLFKEKLSGVFPQKITEGHPLMESFSSSFFYPQSRHTGVNQSQLAQTDLQVVAQSSALGPTILASKDLRAVYILGHLEYDTDTLKKEYLRDKKRHLDPLIPENYFRNNNPNEDIENTWSEHAVLFYQNWLTFLS
ncbi:homoserine O-acetyltransferase/O-succinyltransferase family protein [Enterococcus sp. LJL98]